LYWIHAKGIGWKGGVKSAGKKGLIWRYDKYRDQTPQVVGLLTRDGP